MMVMVMVMDHHQVMVLPTPTLQSLCNDHDDDDDQDENGGGWMVSLKVGEALTMTLGFLESSSRVIQASVVRSPRVIQIPDISPFRLHLSKYAR